MSLIPQRIKNNIRSWVWFMCVCSAMACAAFWGGEWWARVWVVAILLMTALREI